MSLMSVRGQVGTPLGIPCPAAQQLRTSIPTSQLMSCTGFVESVPGGQLPARGGVGRRSEAATPSLMCPHSEDRGQMTEDSGQRTDGKRGHAPALVYSSPRHAGSRPAPLQDTVSESHVEWTDSTADTSQGALGQVWRTHPCQHLRSNR